jgi:phage terminase large subunit-like protein
MTSDALDARNQAASFNGFSRKRVRRRPGAASLQALSQQLAEATGKVQDIAVKAIEGAAGRRALDAANEIALEQAKQNRPS